MSNPIVNIEQGDLKGKLCKTANNIDFITFKGIPYAKPPIGDRRFSIPEQPDPWKGVKDATETCKICAQFDGKTQSVVGDEDCLYLNVYTPKLPPDHPLKPVMVYIHGGGFVFGNGTDDSTHGADYLVEKEVVVVSFNYRLGVLGFLSLGCKDAPGNMGLMDQVQALVWVQKNISKFGGDPKNVTIFGVSAGGSSVEYLLLSPLAKGLFQKAIAQSGSTLLPWAQSMKVKELAYKMPAKNGITISTDGELLKYLKSLSRDELIKLSMAVLSEDSWRGGIHFGFVPTVEKPGDWTPFLDKKPYDLLKRGEFTKVPFISGFCTREGLLMIANEPSRLEKLTKDKNFLDYLPFKVDETGKPHLEEILKAVYLEKKQAFDEEDAFAIDFFSDVDFIGGGCVSAKLIAKYSSPAYFYEFAYDGAFNYLKKKLNINRKGACHGDEGGYLIKSEILKGQVVSDTDGIVRKRMVEMWANFAKYGEPTPQVNELITTKWKPFTKNNSEYLYIDKNLEMKQDLYPERVKLFEELYEKYDLST